MKKGLWIFFVVLIGLILTTWLVYKHYNEKTALLCIIIPDENLNRQFVIKAACQDGVKKEKVGNVEYITIKDSLTTISDHFESNIAIAFFTPKNSNSVQIELDDLVNITNQIKVLSRNDVTDSCNIGIQFKISKD
ncbi:hypothetical protein [Fulvivirga sp.]|uniref:hypothetical protein n=1 Tax=Fulvivirga sp. TaxID=1931237 RepID=UPI0032F093EA